MIHKERIRTSSREELIDITSFIKNVVKKSNIVSGIAFIYVPHTTCGITINENADPDVKKDIINALANIGIESISFYHLEGNSPAHVKSTIVGSSITVFIENSDLVLGRWQGIMLAEFDGPREREVWIKIIKEL